MRLFVRNSANELNANKVTTNYLKLGRNSNKTNSLPPGLLRKRYFLFSANFFGIIEECQTKMHFFQKFKKITNMKYSKCSKFGN